MADLLLGLDIGSSSVKASVVDASSGKTIAGAQSPSEEMGMLAVQPGWAEQDPELWWEHVQKSIRACIQNPQVKAADIRCVGISYQMHGLVVIGKDQAPLRPSIIWCDSRAVPIGDAANKALGEEFCLQHFLNSPGNFTASKLRWVRENEPDVFKKVFKFMLPGDYIAMKLTGEIVTTDTGLSEGVLWDYQSKQVATSLLDHYGIAPNLVADLKPVFSEQGRLRNEVAKALGLPSAIPVSYRAGDQPNNAFSLNVLNPGETAATAGTSGVIYAVTDKAAYDPQARVNTFVHVNSTAKSQSNGVLLCINGTGILNSWLRKNLKATGSAFEYPMINQVAAEAPIGSDGLAILPFGNGAERVLQNKNIGSQFCGLDFNRHTQAHLFRAAQEGIVFALRYGFDVLRNMGLETRVIRAGHANMFLSPLFREAFVNTTAVPLQLYNTDGATGAAIGAGVGAGIFGSMKEAFRGLEIIREEKPDGAKLEKYEKAYKHWKSQLDRYL